MAPTRLHGVVDRVLAVGSPEALEQWQKAAPLYRRWARLKRLQGPHAQFPSVGDDELQTLLPSQQAAAVVAAQHDDSVVLPSTPAASQEAALLKQTVFVMSHVDMLDSADAFTSIAHREQMGLLWAMYNRLTRFYKANPQRTGGGSMARSRAKNQMFEVMSSEGGVARLIKLRRRNRQSAWNLLEKTLQRGKRWWMVAACLTHGVLPLISTAQVTNGWVELAPEPEVLLWLDAIKEWRPDVKVQAEMLGDYMRAVYEAAAGEDVPELRLEKALPEELSPNDSGTCMRLLDLSTQVQVLDSQPPPGSRVEEVEFDDDNLNDIE